MEHESDQDDTLHMANSFLQIYVHAIFSTKNRQKWIEQPTQLRLWKYIRVLGKAKNISVIEVGGMSDHVHILFLLPTTHSIPKVIQVLKGNTSRWIKQIFPDQDHFQWQEGYAAYSVSSSAVKNVINYIQNQERHHTNSSFDEEYRMFLQKHGVVYEQKYCLG